MSYREEIIGGARLILGDCRDVLPTLSGVDAVICDPPYGINWKPRVNHQDQVWVDDVQFDPRQLLSIGRYHLFWGAQYFATSLPISEGWLTWIKRPVTFDFSGDDRSYATVELAWRDWGKARHISHVWDGGKRQGVADNRTFCHPAQKPVEVMDWCIRSVPDDARTILDAYMGSGTTGVACARLGRKFIGIECHEPYFDIAVRRITEAQRQGDMLRDMPQAEDPADARIADMFAGDAG